MFERHKHGPPASSTPRRDRIFEHYFFGTPSPSEAGSGDERARSQRVTFQANSPPYHSNQQQDRPSQVKFERFQDRGKIDFVVKLPPEFEMYDLSVPDGSLDFTLGMQGYHGREFAVVMQRKAPLVLGGIEEELVLSRRQTAARGFMAWTCRGP